MNRFYILFLALLFIKMHSQAGEGVTNKTVRLRNGGLSLMVQDSKLDASANAVLWTETNTSSQRWLLSDTGRDSYYLQNAYSHFYLGGISAATANTPVGLVSQTTARTRGMWEAVPVEGKEGVYILYLGSARRIALGAPLDPKDGSQAMLLNASTAEESRIQWTIEETEAFPTELTEAVRDDMMDRWRDHYYHKASTGYVIGRGGWWGDAEMFEVVLDALETTGEARYATMFENLYKNFCQRNNTDWSGNEYNDDIAWMCIACVRAYLLTGNTEYRTRAKQNFDKMYARSQKHANGTLLWRQSSPDGTNSCVNGPAAVCACYLAEALGQESYYEKAASIYAGERSILFNINSSGTFNGQVYDSYNMKEKKVSNTWSSTYNQGTCLGAAVMLYNHYGKAQYRSDADAIMKWTAQNLADSHGIIKVCQTVSGDLTGFKGILMRYVRRYAADLDHPEYYDWLARNAFHAWNNRNSQGISMSAWLHKTTENFNYSDGGSFDTDGVGAFTAVSAAFNAHLGVQNHIDAYQKTEAEQFSYLQGTPVSPGTDDDATRMAGPMLNQQYIGYRRVDFGQKAASDIVVRMKLMRPLAKLMVYADDPRKGQLLCTISGGDLEAADQWCEVHKVLDRPISGQHDIYLVASGTSRIQLIYLNWFYFECNSPLYVDMTNNGGSLTSSIPLADGARDMAAQSELAALTDDDVLTEAVFSCAPTGESWIQYQSAWPFRLRSYSLFGGLSAADPVGWTLLGSSDGTEWTELDRRSDVAFSVRGQKMQFPVATQRDYTCYRLVLDLPEGAESSVSLSEWQLYGCGLSDRDVASDGGTASSGLEALCDHDTTTAASLAQPGEFIFQTEGSYLLSGYSFTIDATAEAPTSWTLYGSENGRTWTAIEQCSGQDFPFDGYTAVYPLADVPAYRHFRIAFEGESDTAIRLSEIQLLGRLDFGRFYPDLTQVCRISSSDQGDVSALFDDDGYTRASLTGDVPSLSVELPLPTRVLAYSIVAADVPDSDPREITLLGTQEDGTQSSISRRTLSFDTRGERFTNSISSSKLFTSLELSILSTAGDAPARIAELEVYGTSIADAGSPLLLLPDSVGSSATPATASEGVEKLNDQSKTTRFRTLFDAPQSVLFSYSEPRQADTYAITDAKDQEGRDPMHWVLEGSVDGQTWNLLDHRQGQVFSHRYATQFYRIASPGAYSFYRLTVQGVYGSLLAPAGQQQLQIGQLQLLNMGQDVHLASVPSADLSLSIRHGLLSIHTSAQALLTIHDMQGRQVLGRSLAAGYSAFSLGILSPGLYVVSVQSGSNRVSRTVKR